ncbi:MAG: Eco57I restriction-modification methylase domain-containing protein [Bacteroidales bacterium]|nr:Eco57I restriction-modification methylase domain-containing protein [Bacteroidales bacterium]
MQGNSLISSYAGIDFSTDKKKETETSIKNKKAQIKETISEQNEIQSKFLKILKTENKQDKKLKKELEELAKTKNKLEKELIKLENSKNKEDSDKYKKLIKDFEELKNEYQNEAIKENKDKLRDKIEKIILKIFDEKISQHIPKLKIIEEKYSYLPNKEQREKVIFEEKQKLTKSLGFNIEQIKKDLVAYTEGRKPKDFFLWNVYFAEVFSEKGGFDVVIGNPPYVSAPTMIKIYSKMRDAIINTARYATLYQKWDLYIPFMELGLQLLTNKGVFSMIVPYPLTNQNYALKLRELIINQYNLIEIVDLNGTKIFENATVSNCVPFISKSNSEKACYVSKLNESRKIEKAFVQKYTGLVQDENTLVWNLTTEKRQSNRHSNLNVLGDYCYISKGMVINADEKTAKGEFVKDDLISESYDEIHCRKYIEAKDIERYNVKKIRYLEYNTERCPDKLSRPTFRELYEKPKLMFNRLGNLQVYLDETTKFLHSDSMFSAVLWKNLEGVENKSISASVKRYSNYTRKEMVDFSKEIDLRFLLAVLNSKYASVLLTNIRAGDYHIYPEHIRNIPIPKISTEKQKPFETVVNKIINKKELGEDTTTEEQQIDLMVYKLYELTYEEVKIIEPEFAMSKAEYENYSL